MRPAASINAVAGYRTVIALVALTFVGLIGRLWLLQITRGEYYSRKTTDNVVKEVQLPATRGEIRDRSGRVLVENRPSWNVYVAPAYLTEDGVQRLSRVLRLSSEQVTQLRARCEAKKGLERRQPLLAFEDIDRDAMATLLSDRDNLPGVNVEVREHRSYKQGRLASHVLGYMNQISADELLTLKDRGYHPSDYVGRAGIERQFEKELRGHDGYDKVVVDARGNKKLDLDADDLSHIIDGPQHQDPQPGDNVVLALDLDLQGSLEKALRRYPSAAAVVVEVRSGRILALASHPAFDPNVLTGRLTHAEDERLQKDPFRPMIDKALRENYFPGSTFKVIPALAALEEVQVDADEKMKCTGALKLPGHTFRCMEVHGNVDLHDALVQSCNIFFYHLGERVGMDRMARLAEDFGFGAPTGIGLPGEVPGFIPTLDWYKKQGGGFRFGYTLNTAIGQGSVKVTVLQLALAYAAIANGGDVWQPQIVDRVEAPSGAVIQAFPPVMKRHLAVKPEHLTLVQEALCGVVNEEKGTAAVARDGELPFDVCGKTGTAQVRKNRKGEGIGWDEGNDHAWFAGWGPARNPELAMAVLVEHGGLGGKVAAPIVMDVFRAWSQRRDRNAAAVAAGPAPVAPAPTPGAAAAPTPTPTPSGPGGP